MAVADETWCSQSEHWYVRRTVLRHADRCQLGAGDDPELQDEIEASPQCRQGVVNERRRPGVNTLRLGSKSALPDPLV
jgi:hypothetical protein